MPPVTAQSYFFTETYPYKPIISSKQKQPRPKRVPSTTENLEDDKRKHMSQPVPNQLTNVEQKNKAKKRRESRRSTQGVTLDIVKEAKNFVEETKKESKRKNITTGSTAGELAFSFNLTFETFSISVEIQTNHLLVLLNPFPKFNLVNFFRRFQKICQKYQK